MKATIKELLKHNKTLIFLNDGQDWEVIINKDFYLDDVVSYQEFDEDDEYILIKDNSKNTIKIEIIKNDDILKVYNNNDVLMFQHPLYYLKNIIDGFNLKMDFYIIFTFDNSSSFNNMNLLEFYEKYYDDDMKNFDFERM